MLYLFIGIQQVWNSQSHLYLLFILYLLYEYNRFEVVCHIYIYRLIDSRQDWILPAHGQGVSYTEIQSCDFGIYSLV